MVRAYVGMVLDLGDYLSMKDDLSFDYVNISLAD